MRLLEIVTALETTATEQRPRCVPTIDNTDVSLRERFEVHTDALPCTPAAAERVVETHRSGASIGASMCDAGIASVTAAKLLHRYGEADVAPLVPETRRIVHDWIDGCISRTDTLAFAGAEPSEFALATYAETHDPINPLVEAVEGALADHTNAVVAKRGSLAETVSSITDMQF